MAIGKSSRIVIDVDDVALKRDLYAALATEGRSLKDWFSSAVSQYLAMRSAGRAGRVTEPRAEYGAATKKRRS
jgi:hypothetical protein